MRPSPPALADEAQPPRGGSAPPAGAEPPAPDARMREASREAGRKIARAFAASAEELAEAEALPKEVPKPYTTPPGYKAPTMGEQFRYAAMRHPYSRYTYLAAFVFGIVGYAVATEDKKHPEWHKGRVAPATQQAADASGSSGVGASG